MSYTQNGINNQILEVKLQNFYKKKWGGVKFMVWQFLCSNTKDKLDFIEIIILCIKAIITEYIFLKITVSSMER